MNSRRQSTPEGRSCSAACNKSRLAGLTLIELIMFILVVSIALVGVLMVMNTAVRGSADPLVRKQALAIAESLLTEIEQQPFTYCDLQDANVETATSTAGCTGGAAASQDKGGGVAGSAIVGPMPASEARGNGSDPYDNVADYGNFSLANFTDILGGNTMNGYSASVAITRAGNAAPFAAITDPGAVLRIAVTVTGLGESITLVGYRVRYAPNI
jgi:MSHA pilin protein MshD